MKKIVFDFIRSPYERISQVKHGIAPKESLLGYCYLKTADYPVTTSNKELEPAHLLKNYSIIYRIESWRTADVVVIPTRFSISLALLSRILGKETIFYDSMQRLPKSKIKRARIRVALMLAHKAIFFSSNQLRQWEKYFPQLKEKGHAINYGIDSEFFQCNKNQKTNHTDQYLSIGRDPNRDFHILAEAFKDTDKKLTLVTKDYLLNPDLKCNPSIEILDDLSYDDLKIKYLESCATIIPILPGTTHLSGIRAAMESMANRTLVIIARTESLEEYFEDQKHVLFYEPGSYESLLQAIEISKNKEIRDRLIANSYFLVTTKYSYIGMAKSLMSLIGSEEKLSEKTFSRSQFR